MFHSYPYTDFHELNIDSWLQKMKELADDINNFIRQLEKDTVGINTDDRYFNRSASASAYTIYIAGTSGDDDNIGSADAPVKTFDRAALLASTRYNDTRFVFLEAGTYDIDYISITTNVHIAANVPGVILNLKRNLPFYSSHINISGNSTGVITIVGNGYTLYGDGCAWEWNYVDIQADLRCYGGSMNFTNTCTIHNLTCQNGYIWFGDNVTFANTVVNRAVLALTNAMVYFGRQWYYDLTDDDNRDFLLCYGTQFVNTYAPVAVDQHTFKYARNNMNLGEFISTATAYNAMKNMAASNNFGAGLLSNITL